MRRLPHMRCVQQSSKGTPRCESTASTAQIAGETEVKALIKLRLRKADGTSLVVSRSFMLTQVPSWCFPLRLETSLQYATPVRFWEL